MIWDPGGFPGRRTLGFVTAFNAPVRGLCAPHSHPSIEIVLHLGTSGHTTLSDGHAQSFVPDSVVIYAPFQVHSQQADVPGEDLCIHVSSDRSLPPSLDRMLYVPPPIDPWCIAEIASLLLTSANPTPGQQAVLDHRSTAILAHLFLRHDSVPPRSQTPTQRLVEQAKEVLRADYRQDCHLSDVSLRLGVSPDYLRHRFRDIAGQTPLAFLTAIRLERAKTLLANTNLPLAAIASDSGFATARYFCNVFRRKVGMTPTAFRRRS